MSRGKKAKDPVNPKSQSEESTTSSKKKRVNGAKKGKQFERDISNALGHIFPEAQRFMEYQSSNNIGVDIEGTRPFLIQCKNYAGYAPIGKINEVRSKDPNDIPVLVTKGIRLEAMAVLPFEKFVTLLEIVYGHAPSWGKPAPEERRSETAIRPFDIESFL